MDPGSLCLFSSYSDQNSIPFWVKTYLEELTSYIETLVLLTNERELQESDYQFLETRNIEVRFYPNEGWDFGMWFRYLVSENTSSCSSLFLINDSNLLIGSLKNFFTWWKTHRFDFGGLTENWELAWHIQSFFLGFRGNTVEIVRQYFAKTGILKDKVDAILFYEIGLSRHLKSRGLTPGVLFPTSTVSPWGCDTSIYRPKRLIRRGYPLVKRSLIYRSSYAFYYRWIFRKEVGTQVLSAIRPMKPSLHGLFWESLDRVLFYGFGWKSLPRIKPY